jgi:hypothetical protein
MARASNAPEAGSAWYRRQWGMRALYVSKYIIEKEPNSYLLVFENKITQMRARLTAANAGQSGG